MNSINQRFTQIHNHPLKESVEDVKSKFMKIKGELESLNTGS